MNEARALVVQRRASRLVRRTVPLPPLDVVQAKLRCFACPDTAWQVPTFGALQQLVKQRYRERAKQTHPERLEQRHRLTLDQVVALKVARMEGATYESLAALYGLGHPMIKAILEEKAYAFHDPSPGQGATFQRLTQAYQWLRRFPPQTPLPRPDGAPLWQEYRQLKTPLCAPVAPLTE